MEGYIGFFDILGYQSFLKNNSDEAVQDDVLKFISKAEKPGEDDYKQVFPKVVGSNNETIVKAIWNAIEWLVFSDTIVISLAPKLEENKGFYPLIFLKAAQSLMHQMFEYGLPLRGAAHYGQYNFIDHSMAGRGIVEAYEYGKELNLSACVISPAMIEKMKDVGSGISNFAKVYEQWMVPYSTPMNDGTHQQCTVLRVGTISGLDQNDIRDYVHRMFWSHKKNLENQGAITKVEETERFLRFCNHHFKSIE